MPLAYAEMLLTGEREQPSTYGTARDEAGAAEESRDPGCTSSPAVSISCSPIRRLVHGSIAWSLAR